MPSVKKVEDKGGEFYHVRIRPPWQFEEVRVPGWAAKVAQSVSRGSKVKMGRTMAGNWLVQAVMIRKEAGQSKARTQARRIQRKIEG